MFRASSAHLQEDTVVHVQHMVLSLSTRVPGGLSIHSLSVCVCVYRQATTNSRREWQYHMLHMYNCILLKMCTWCSKHVEVEPGARNWLYYEPYANTTGWYAAITLTASIPTSKKPYLVVLAKHMSARWWWSLHEPKHVGASVIILYSFNILWFYNDVHQLEI